MSGYIALHAQCHRLLLVRSQKRRWWRVWKPKWQTETLMEKPWAVKTDDSVKLLSTGGSYLGMVNDEVVLRWPQFPSSTTGFRIDNIAKDSS